MVKMQQDEHHLFAVSRKKYLGVNITLETASFLLLAAESYLLVDFVMIMSAITQWTGIISGFTSNSSGVLPL